MRTWSFPGLLAVVSMLLALAGCGTSGDRDAFADDASAHKNGDATLELGGDGGVLSNGDGAAPQPIDCSGSSENQATCSCPVLGASQPCYTGDPSTRNVGACADGTQTCMQKGEFSGWSDCTGSVLPATESCSGTVDTNCNGKVGCDDPQCATDPICNTSCNDGDTRVCYTGLAGTENVGTCKDGQQTCVGGQWPADCKGEVVPAAEDCCDALDHNCNRLPGCLDLFACILAPCCQTQCKAQLDPGCVCPRGSGDTETCPLGDHDVHSGSIPGGFDECCPCTDCNDINCCGNELCKNDAFCATLQCHSLPDSCNGQVDADCDDFPEDCDEPCCLCTDGSC